MATEATQAGEREHKYVALVPFVGQEEALRQSKAAIKELAAEEE